MFRLTHQDRYGSCFCGVYLAALDLDVKDNKNLRIAAARLSAYEDTGLMPEQISALQAEAERLRAENEAYKADIEAGRLIRLPDFPQDMNDILEPLKVQSALNSEVMKLNFRKEHRPKDVSILDYTIIAALRKRLDDAESLALKGDCHGSDRA